MQCAQLIHRAVASAPSAAILSGYEVSWDRVWELLRGFELGEALSILKTHAARNPLQIVREWVGDREGERD